MRVLHLDILHGFYFGAKKCLFSKEEIIEELKINDFLNHLKSVALDNRKD